MPEASQDSKAGARNALNKISGIFGRAQKPRWIQDFHILFSHSDPNRRYKSGDVVRGEVHIRPNKPVRVTHITLALYGYAQVFKNFNAPGDGQSREASHTDPGRLLTSPGVVKLFSPVERTLHGECKLPSRLLKFQFAIPLPSHRLPTSIDFERGTISYQLVATITRPTAITPVLRCEPRKLYVNEDIDVSLFPAPKPRMVTLEPVETKSKKARRRKKATVAAAAVAAPNGSTVGESLPDPPDSPRSSVSNSRSGSRASFAPSDNASISNCSESIEFRLNPTTTSVSGNCNSNNGSGSGNGQSGGGGGGGGGGGSNRNSRSGAGPTGITKVVHASAEVLRGAFLPGDKIPVRVLVTHTKPIKSMCGVIVTLYRKTHIDTQPVLHRKVVDANGYTTVEAIAPEVYTRSMTGLGGLLFSSSGTSSTYRMDIAQAAVPLIVNPQTLQADVTTNIEIPYDSITPTITKVKGESIDFKYYVEVCLDLQGKLELSRFLPRLTAQPRYGFGKPSASTNASIPLNLAAQGAHLIDTQLIRRERPQIIAWQFHVIVGTRDSSRAAAHRNREGWSVGDGPLLMAHGGKSTVGDQTRSGNLSDVQEDWAQEDSIGLDGTIHHGQDAYDDSDQVHEIRSHHASENAWDRSSSNLSSAPTTQGTPPPPPSFIMPEEPVNEKERLRRHEERLLPSAPPMEDSAGSSSSAAMMVPAPSAPHADDVDGTLGNRWETEARASVRDSGYGSSGTSQNDQNRPRLHQYSSHASHTISIEEDGNIMCSCGASRGVAQPNFHADGGSSSSSSNSGRRPQQAEQQDSHTGGAVLSHTSETAAFPAARGSTDDKQELERRRLMAERSAPTYDNPDEIVASSSRLNMPAPSAPTLGELVEGEDHRHAAFGEWSEDHDEPPQYER